MKATSLERTVRLLHVLTMISLIVIINIEICNFFQVEQKNRENQELTTICDDLIAKVKISENLHYNNLKFKHLYFFLIVFIAGRDVTGQVREQRFNLPPSSL